MNFPLSDPNHYNKEIKSNDIQYKKRSLQRRLERELLLVISTVRGIQYNTFIVFVFCNVVLV